MRTVAVVDYGMGNLRSVSQAVMHVAARTAWRGGRHLAPGGVSPPSAWCCPGQGACATACASCATRA